MAPQQRILIATGGVNPEARIQIGAGQFAGSEIHIALAGTCVEARLLTANEASRQTLIAAMDAVLKSLRVRGLVVETAPAGRARDRHDQNDGRRQREWKREFLGKNE